MNKKKRLLGGILSEMPNSKFFHTENSPLGVIYKDGYFELEGNPLDLDICMPTRLGNYLIMTDGFRTWGSV